jgi:hypothetical protein
LHDGRNVFPDLFHHPVGVGEQRAKGLVEGFDNFAEGFQLWLRLESATVTGAGSIAASLSASAIFIAACLSTR